MFPHKSSSYAISSKANAFVQNFKVEGEWRVVVGVSALAVLSASSREESAQAPISCCTYQVPVSSSVRDAVSVSVSVMIPEQSNQIKCSHTVGCERRVVGQATRGKEGRGAGPLLPLAVQPPTFSPSPLLFFYLSPCSRLAFVEAASVIITSSTTTVSTTLGVDDNDDLMIMMMTTTARCSSTPSTPSALTFELKVSNAMVASDGNTCSLSAQIGHHPTNNLASNNNRQLLPHITSQAKATATTTTHKFGAPYFHNNNPTDGEDDDRFKIVCVNDECTSNVRSCPPAATEHNTNIPMQEREKSVAATVGQKSFKYHCDHNDSVSNNNCNTSDKINVGVSEYWMYARRWGIAAPRLMRLAGGGESSLNNSSAAPGGGGAGWGGGAGGGNAAQNNNNANQQTGSWGGNAAAQQQQTGGGTAPQQQNNNGSGGAQWGGSGGGNGGQGRQTGAAAGAGAQPTSQQQANTAQQNNSGNNGGMKPAVSSGGGPASNNQQSQQPTSTSQQQQPNNNQPNNQQQAGNNNSNNNGGQQQQQNGGGSWAAAAGKGLAASTPPPSASSSAASGGGSGGGNGAAPASASTAAAAAAQQAATNKQLEQLNTMRESLFSLDGWGGQHVNQDSTWDIPPSPEPPSNKDGSGGGGAGGGTGNGAAPGAGGGAPVWKPNINNGTELWEANLRNGGQVPVVVGGGAGGAGGGGGGAQKTPWGHTPSSNLGGTWGVEDDDLSDATNVWTGVPPPGPPQQQPPPQQQQQPPPQQWGNSQPNTPIWAAPKKENDWGGGGGSQWGGGGGGGGGDHMMMRGGGGGRGGDMGGWPPQQPPPHHPSQQPPHPSQLPPHHQMPPNKMPPNANVNQWPGPPPKDMGGMGKGGGGPSGWEEPSPPAQRRNIPNYDDGTSLWGAQQQRNTMPGQNKVSHWKEMPSPASMVGGRGGGMGGGQMGPGGGAMPVGRMPTKDGPLWGGGGGSRNGAWDGGHEVVGGGPWDDGKQQVGPGGQWGGGGEVGGWKGGGPKQMQGNPSASWGADGGPPLGDGPLPLDPSSWAHQPKQPLKPLTKEIIWASKQFRILSEMGFEKDKVETALRTFNMSLEDAIEYLNAANCPRGGGDWGRGGGGGGRGHSPPPVGPPPPFDAQPPPPPQFAAAAASQRGGGQGGGGGFNPPIPGFVPPSQLRPSNQQPASNQQLRMLVQQIQLAVTAGYLNHQILNQPLAPQTLLLLNQLLQQIKLLHQLQHALQQNPMAKNSNSLGMSVQITKTKQQITNLQNQISAQQAIYVKLQQNPQQQAHQQQQQQQQLSQNDFFGGAGKGNPHDPLAALQSNFADIALKESQSQQSRLSQWKLPSLPSDKDDDFSRAPGSVAKSGAAGGNSSPNALNPLLSQPDTTWSVGRSSDTGWPDSSSNHHDGGGDKDWPGAVTGVGSSQSAAASFTDLVPEFEPGKPWKGNQMKSIEDDPTITPGSLQQASAVLTPKGNSVVTSVADDMFGRGGGGGGKVSPPPGPMTADMPPIPSLSLSSSTWSFQPTSQSSFNSPLSKMSMSGGGVGMKTSSQGVGWGGGDPHGGGADMWKSRQGGGGGGPPPGLSKTLPPTAAPSNGWGSLSGRWGPPQHTTWGQPPPAHALWLLLKNLTPQIDGSTLKTLCVQHGPLQSFHMYLPHGIAFAKYSTREEATKAQNALNNCVLGNTTIFADVQPEREIVALLNQLGNSGGGGGGNSQAGAAAGDGNSPWSSSRQPQPKQVVDTWGSGSQLWGGGGGGGTSSSLWGAALDSDRSTPSTASLNSFLPPDLLGGESM